MLDELIRSETLFVEASPTVKSFLAGTVSGTCSTLLFQPLDLVKTMIQCSPSSGKLRQGASMKEVVEVVVRKDRVFGLWRGLQPSFMRCVPGVGVYFSTVHLLQSKTLGEKKPAAYQSLLLGASARTFTATLLIPFTVVKTRIESGNFSYSGVTGALRSIYSLEGRSGLAAGLSATLIRDAPFSAIYLMCYNEAKHTMAWLVSNPVGGVVHFVCGVGSGICASIVTQPADVIKTKMQLNEHRRSFVSVSVGIYQANGITGFFRGLAPRIIRRTLIAAMAWTVYEEIMVRLNLNT